MPKIPKVKEVKTNLALFLEWAKRDKICAAAVFMGIIGIFPHLGDFILGALSIIFTGSKAIAATLGGN